MDCMHGHVCQELKCFDEDLGTCPIRKHHKMDLTFQSWAWGEISNDDTDAADAKEQTPIGSFWF
jgi:hypothetical protein